MIGGVELSGEQVENIEEMLDGMGWGEDPSEPFTLSNGVTLHCKPVPPSLVADVERRFTEPRPPRMFIEAKGREEENPDDPDYQRALAKYNEDLIIARMRVLLASSVVVDEIPDSVQQINDDDWADAIEAAGVVVPPKEKGGARRLAWLIYYALVSIDDQQAAHTRALRMVGTTEGDVAAAFRMFQDIQRWRAAQPQSA